MGWDRGLAGQVGGWLSGLLPRVEPSVFDNRRRLSAAKAKIDILQQGKQPSLLGCRPYSVLHRALLLQGPELLSGADDFRSSGALKYRCIRAASNNVAAISGARHPGNRYRPSTLRLPF